MNNYLFTSESVTEGHPDKMCDIIADAILDEYLKNDPTSRVACEVTATKGIITVMGEISSSAVIDINDIVFKAVQEIGYVDERFGLNINTCAISILTGKQSTDIRMGVNTSLEYKKQYYQKKLEEGEDNDIYGAGDQGIMYGYACKETDNFMPAPIYYAHILCKRLSEVRKQKILDYLGPDGKAMVSFEYLNGIPHRIHTIVLSTQHLSSISQSKIYNDMQDYVIKSVMPEDLFDANTKVLVNPTGRFVIGGPCADTGLTGRKQCVDTYGGVGGHGGGSFSGKDPTKVDRTGAYAARYIAKNIVAADIATKCEVQVSYAIGVANPISIYVNTFGTSSYSDEDIREAVQAVFDFRPLALIRRFDLEKPIYKKLAAYGHMGREDLSVAWEKTDKAKELYSVLNNNIGVKAAYNHMKFYMNSHLRGIDIRMD